MDVENEGLDRRKLRSFTRNPAVKGELTLRDWQIGSRSWIFEA